MRPRLHCHTQQHKQRDRTSTKNAKPTEGLQCVVRPPSPENTAASPLSNKPEHTGPNTHHHDDKTLSPSYKTAPLIIIRRGSI
eukprot:1160761-Pelagomonas_calceolata.AAC.5